MATDGLEGALADSDGRINGGLALHARKPGHGSRDAADAAGLVGRLQGKSRGCADGRGADFELSLLAAVVRVLREQDGRWSSTRRGSRDRDR